MSTTFSAPLPQASSGHGHGKAQGGGGFRIVRLASSLSDLGSSAAKIPGTVHISPLSRPIARYWHCEIVKIWPR
ncbi:hypothetical protein, partial [Massilia sp. CCM 8734]|uniref:hypothetical protein n=1 Tax=Massilia sp. CCM 8734 TaxID=2609283 RepID=UPI001AAF9EAA